LPKILILLSPNRIIHPVGQPFIELITVDSTNNYAMAQVQKGDIQHGTAWFAYDQTAGKGQRGKQWFTEPGQNIALSVALNTNELAVSGQFYLSAAIALAAHGVFSKYAGSESCVKWPNDIYWNDRKAGGILIENIIRGNKWQWAVVGIGININQTTFGGSVGNAVSLKQITGKNFDVVALAKEICTAIGERFYTLQTAKDSLLVDYNAILYKKDKKVRLKKENIVFDAIIKEALPDGRLRVEGAAWDSFTFGEVQWVI
jgi:BirA family biotin operon repressor/biotin-[acetyl-CoA-carboxylase] ligase